MSAPTTLRSRTKVRNDFGCFVQEINSSLVPDTIEWGCVPQGPALWARLLHRTGSVEARDRSPREETLVCLVLAFCERLAPGFGEDEAPSQLSLW